MCFIKCFFSCFIMCFAVYARMQHVQGGLIRGVAVLGMAASAWIQPWVPMLA